MPGLAGEGLLLGGGDWPSADQWRELEAADHLMPAEPLRTLTAQGGRVDIAVALAMPSILYIEMRSV